MSKRLILLSSVLLFVGMVISAQTTDMLILEGNTSGEQNTINLNPLFCTDRNCSRVVDALFPVLLNLDPETGWLIPADDESSLVESWEIDGNTVTYILRDDLMWSDGTPITTYDVFFSYQIAYRTNKFDFALDHHIQGATPVDERIIQFEFVDATCNALPQANFPIIPSHVYEPEFANRIDYAGGDIVEWFEDFEKTPLQIILEHSEYSNPTITYGAYRLNNRIFDESIRLLSEDDTIAFRYDDVPSQTTVVEQFLRGEANLLIDAPYTRLDDLRADPATTLYTYPGNGIYMIALNQAAPENPQAAFAEDGTPIQQDPHPILVDPAVREAMQIALDIPAMMDAVLESNGQQISGVMPPSYFAYMPDRELVSYNVMRAREMLFDAGWRDMDGDGVRECLDCEFSEIDTELSITLGYVDPTTNTPFVDGFALSQLISKQWGDIGIRVSATPQSNYATLFNQTFDTFIIDDVPVDLQGRTVWDFFQQNHDIPSEGYNFTSYHNPEVERLLEDADHVPDCDSNIRRDLYQQAEAILIADYAYLWLFSPNRIIATRQSPNLPHVIWEDILP